MCERDRAQDDKRVLEFGLVLTVAKISTLPKIVPPTVRGINIACLFTRNAFLQGSVNKTFPRGLLLTVGSKRDALIAKLAIDFTMGNLKAASKIRRS